MVYVSDKRLHVNADKSKIVDENSEDAAYLLVAAGGELSDEEAAKYGLAKSQSKAEQSKAEHAPAEDKADHGPANKTGSGLTITKAK